MFGFFNMGDTYEERKVARYETDGLLISTAAVTDSSFPYETAVEHPEYNNGRFVIVENYNTREDAEAGHERWVARMTGTDLPDALVDVGGADVATFIDAFGGDEWRTFKRTKGGDASE